MDQLSLPLQKVNLGSSSSCAAMEPLLQEVTDPSSHALLLPYPAQGHINPLLQLGKRLAAQGVHVTFATMEHLHVKLKRAQALSSQPIRENFQFMVIKDGLPADFERDKWTPELMQVVDWTLQEGTLEVIQTLAEQGRPVTCIVCDFFLRWSSSVAERAAVPEFVFWPQCASAYSIYLHVDYMISAGYDPYEANVKAASARDASMEVPACIPGLAMSIHPADLPFESPVGKVGLEWLRGVLAYRYSRLSEARGVIINSFEALEPEVFKALSLELEQPMPHPQYDLCCWPRCIKLVGPLVPKTLLGEKGDEVSGASLWQEEMDECKQWLDKQPTASVLFVAFGSFVFMDFQQVRELALGLAASGQRFLWVIRENAIKSDPVDQGSLATESFEGPLEEVLPKGFLEENESRCKIVRWAPQALVLAHPSVGGFFSHCGWNSTLESVCAGMPILCWPWMMDQVTNCWLASHIWKVGLSLQRNHVNGTSKEFVESGVRQLMEGPLAEAMRARARQLGESARLAARRDDALRSLVEIIHSRQ